MLRKLSIDNYALIEKSVMDFDGGFTVITGQTGAGKSIMLDALGLLRGARADFKAMGDKDKKTIVESIFSSRDESLRKIFEENTLDWDPDELIIRREILPSGKSRGFINDTPVTLQVLAMVADKLIDIHSQHSNSLLNKPEQQLSMIDSFGGSQDLLNEYKTSFQSYISLRHRIKNIKDAAARGKENLDFITFRLEQLDKLKPKRGELASLEKEAEILGDADRIKSELTEAVSLLSGGGGSVMKLLQNVSSIIDGLDLSLFDTHGDENIGERLNSSRIDLRDISDTLESYSEKIASDPERFEKIQARIEALYEAQKRFKVKSEDELVSLHEQLRTEIKAIGGEDADLVSMEKELKEKAKILKDKAEKLTEARIRAAENFIARISETIQPLGLPNFKFEIDIKKGKLTSEGQDTVTFLCSFNKNHPIQPISDIASGGEIARVMLGIKSVMASHISMPTLIFDEIDTGVSGEIAHKMGSTMKEMSSSMQVMAITHLPQVAANGDTHFKVYKDDKLEKTISHILKLNKEQRIEEIAGMLSGTAINQAALENARILLGFDKP